LTRDAAVLDDVVQERGLKRRGVEMQAREDHRDLERMVDEGLTGLARLSGVLLSSEDVRLLQLVRVRVRVVRTQLRLDPLDGRRHRRCSTSSFTH